jgi:recombinational DNA repair protein RecT
MYQGLLRRFRRSGQFKSVSAHVVYEGEAFTYFIDENGPHLNHVPGDQFEAPIVKVYARAATKDGGIFIEVMSKAEIDKHRKVSRATREDSPWKMWFEEMAKKTAIIRLSKYLPDARDLVGDDDLSDDFEPPLPSVAAGNSGAQPTINASAAAAAQTADGGEQAQTAPPNEAPEVSNSATAVESAPADSLGEGDVIADAYRRGVKAKANNSRRAAIPREFTDGQHDQEAAAWLAGFDGKSPPTEEDSQHEQR